MDSALSIEEPGVSIRILAVDDKLENLVALEGAFRDVNYELIQATSGYEALRILETMDFAAILLDVQMPELDGYQTAQLIRKGAHSKNIPIIFVTAIHRNEVHEHKGYVSGGVDFLFKPINKDILLAKISVFADLYRAKWEAQKNAEILRQQALKEQEIELLRHNLSLRDEFISIASHELNTPLTPLSLQMQAFLKMLNEGRLLNMDVDRLKRMLENAHDQVDRLSRLIKELLDVSRITTGKLRLLPREVNLVPVVQSVLDAFAEQIREIGCQVFFHKESDLTGTWDRMRVEQIIVNLLSNALKYGLGRPIEISVRGEQGFAVIQVRDRGIGISKENQARIFGRFERAVSSQNYGGLGLGLYITEKIVHLHEGSISVESELNQGSVFTIRLPLQPCFQEVG